MANEDRRYVYPPPDIRDRIGDLAREIGARAAGRVLGLSRAQVASVAAGLQVQPGTMALLRERLRLNDRVAEGRVRSGG